MFLRVARLRIAPFKPSPWSPSSLSIISTREIHHKPPPFPTTPTCPSSSCQCAPMPQMPENLPIDHSKPLNGTMALYAMHLLICTGKPDWPSRIEDDDGGDNLAADVKELVGRGGEYVDPYHNILISNSSFPPSAPPRQLNPETINTSAYLFPAFKYIPLLPRVSFSAVESLVHGYLLPKKLNKAHEGLSPIHRDRLTRKEGKKSALWEVRDVEEVVVLVCGHGRRDERCGILGPVLINEFETQLERQQIKVLHGPVQIDTGANSNKDLLGEEETEENEQEKLNARVALISHIGGHKFAGNVIVYIPPKWRGEDGELSPLAGKGIWYGRVEPKLVEGIVRETVRRGTVIEELFRGGIGRDGEVLRL